MESRPNECERARTKSAGFVRAKRAYGAARGGGTVLFSLFFGGRAKAACGRPEAKAACGRENGGISSVRVCVTVRGEGEALTAHQKFRRLPMIVLVPGPTSMFDKGLTAQINSDSL